MARAQARARITVASSSREDNNQSRKNTSGDSKEKGHRRSAENTTSRRIPSEVQTSAAQGHGLLNRIVITSMGSHAHVEEGLPYICRLSTCFETQISAAAPQLTHVQVEYDSPKA